MLMKNNSDSTLFYNKIKKYKGSVSELLSQPSIFQSLPMDWEIVVTDIENSTNAVQNGLSEIVNLVATGSIVAVLNIAAKYKIDIPFFFGGDGATMLIPPTLLSETMSVLNLHKANIKKEFDINLRVGSYRVAKIYDEKVALKIAKVNITELFAIPIILGNGLLHAESIIKSNDHKFEPNVESLNLLNLEGMECRWDKIPPPENTSEVVCLLIDAINVDEQASVYKSILDKAEKLYGPHNHRNPISILSLRLSFGLDKIKNEMVLRKPRFYFFETFKAWLSVFVGKYIYFPSSSGQSYLNDLVQLSDIFILDGRINMIISGTSKQRTKLVKFLDKLESKRKIIYGIHVSKESIISCYVQDRKKHHIHFINGSNGGYTQAAILLKKKLKNKTPK